MPDPFSETADAGALDATALGAGFTDGGEAFGFAGALAATALGEGLAFAGAFFSAGFVTLADFATGFDLEGACLGADFFAGAFFAIIREFRGFIRS